MSMLATFTFIRAGEFEDALAIVDLLMRDEEDLMHKAAGWMLREVGKRDVAVLEVFLKPRCGVMPRTMLRYAIERFPEAKRQRYLKGG
jgi:3-methyladenine DNA glycosylase AlkD